MKTALKICYCLLAMLCYFTSASAAPLQLGGQNGAAQAFGRSEFTVSGVPEAKNPFDPDEIAVDVAFTAPDGSVQKLPAFWFQDFTRKLNDKNQEQLASNGVPGWRVRWTPLSAGAHRWQIVVTQQGQKTVSGAGAINVAPGAPRGFARVEPKQKRFFQTTDGKPLPLFGENLCWHGARGTFDYDDWFAGYRKAGLNYARLWMWNSAFGIEFLQGERLNYNQERAWKLDYVLNEAEKAGVYTMLCLDYHGVFNVEPDMWGGNNWWPKHPYNKANGGPCETQNDWFTDADAQKLYRKRLRYLIGRYASHPNLLSWQFFNEINNVYRYLKPADVVAWHDRQAQWLHANDPYRHMVTTSFGSAGDDAAMWKLPSLDYANYHWYGNWGGPYAQVTQMAAGVSQDFHARYAKPVHISEFGTHGGGGQLNRDADPHKRGLRQALWMGALAGTAGTIAPWWWEQNHAEDNYHLWGAVKTFLDGSNFGSATWQPLSASAPKASTELGEAVPGGAPFEVKISTSGNWGAKTKGIAALRSAQDADVAAFNPFVHGQHKADLRNPFILQAHLAAGAKLTIHVNSVANDAVLAVKAGGKELFRRALPNKDGGYQTNKEYDEDFEIALPAGRQEIEIFNPGGDWVNVDWVKLSGVLPAKAANQTGVPLDVWAQSDGKSALVYIVDPRFSWPRGRDAASEKLSGGIVTLRGLPDGNYRAQWQQTTDNKLLGETTARSQNGAMQLPVAEFEVDVAAKIIRQ